MLVIEQTDMCRFGYIAFSIYEVFENLNTLKNLIDVVLNFKLFKTKN